MTPERSTAPSLEELVKISIDVSNALDFDALVDMFAPDAVFDISPLGVFEGRPAIRKLLEEWLGMLEDLSLELEEVEVLREDLTLAVVLERGRPAGSDAYVALRYAAVATWAGGLMLRARNFTDIAAARAFARLLAAQ
ncbi:MAG TPA: nuclear transport factor 2 family protein [Solirubrobacteraceae bacterium]|nr:nuclear transport factor 2 family protein [Solirubrobacteraceae bacterium]